MTCLASADQPILCGVFGAPRIAGNSLGDAGHVLEHPLHTPKATASEDRGLRSRCVRDSLVDDRRLRVLVAETFPLERASHAHRAGELGHTTGKLVLTI